MITPYLTTEIKRFVVGVKGTLFVCFGELRKSKLLIPFLLVSITIFILTCLRANITGITYDEADTFLSYSRIRIGYLFPFLKYSHLNNHLLNSFFISLTTIFDDYNEFLIRLPNLIFFLLYLTATLVAASRTHFKILIFALLAGNYYLTEFFGLARGYAMAAALVLVSLLAYRYSCQSRDRNILTALYFLSFALLANFMAIYIFVAVIFDLVITQREFKKINFIKCYFWDLLLIMLIFSLSVALFYCQSREGMPLPTNMTSLSFTKYTFWGFINHFLPLDYNQTVARTLMSLVFLFCIYPLIQKRGNLSILRTTFLTFLFLFFVTKVMDKEFATGRMLLPFYPLLVLAFDELLLTYRNLLISRKRLLLILSPAMQSVVALLIGVLFIQKVSLTSTKDWRHEYPIKEAFIHYINDGIIDFPLIDHGRGNPTFRFYIAKYNLSSDTTFIDLAVGDKKQ